jgi:hypothetical protein
MANKYVELTTGGLLSEREATVSSAGAGSAGKVVALDATGRLDNSTMPVGIGANTKSLVCSENLAAGDLVNVYNDTGTAKCRKADASGSNAGKRAWGFVLSAVNSGETALVYFEGSITGLSGLTPGAEMFLSGATPGAATATAPTASGYAVQAVGVAISDTEISFEAELRGIRA